MGDYLRQLFYPLLLPAIVFCVWMHAWVNRQESAARRTAPVPQAVAPLPPTPTNTPARGPRFTMMRGDDDGVASADDGHP
jgi:hypothetical protein